MSDYNKLAAEQARVMGVQAVPVVEENHGYASTDGRNIYVNPAFMSRVQASGGEGAVRFILGHELGHIHHGMVGGPSAELDADRFGARSVAAQGFSFRSILGVMGHLDARGSSTHPPPGAREQEARTAFQREMEAREAYVPPPRTRRRR